MSKTYKLVFTVAVKAELPKELYAKANVLTIRALKSGALRGSHSHGKSEGVLFVITGVGLRKAKEAAEWIRNNISPLFVVNIGAAATLESELLPGCWITPEKLTDEGGSSIDVDTRLPFMAPDNFARIVGGTMASSGEPFTGECHDAIATADFVDMEVFAQAAVFEKTGTSFHVVKMITDRGDADAEEGYHQNLPDLNRGVLAIASFLDGPGEPKISVIIPVYNRADRIGKCIDSVLAQTMAPVEIIVVDDGSTDQTLDRLKTYGDKITVIVNNKNEGVSYSRNRGAEAAAGVWLAFLDSDDYWESDKIGSQWRYLKRYPFYEIVQGEEIWFRNGVRVNQRDYHKKPEGWIFHQSLERCLVSPSSVVMKKSLFESAGGFDENLPACEDYDLWLKISRKIPIGLDPSPTTIKHGGHDDQLSKKYHSMDRFRVVALKKALADEKDSTYRAMIEKTAREKLKILLDGSVKRNNYDSAKEYRLMLETLGA